MEIDTSIFSSLDSAINIPQINKEDTDSATPLTGLPAGDRKEPKKRDAEKETKKKDHDKDHKEAKEKKVDKPEKEHREVMTHGKLSGHLASRSVPIVEFDVNVKEDDLSIRPVAAAAPAKIISSKKSERRRHHSIGLQQLSFFLFSFFLLAVESSVIEPFFPFSLSRQ